MKIQAIWKDFINLTMQLNLNSHGNPECGVLPFMLPWNSKQGGKINYTCLGKQRIKIKLPYLLQFKM